MDAVKLTLVRNEMEAEMLCGLLRTHGIACSYRKTDVAGAIGAESGGFAIAGQTEVLVHQHDLDVARKLLPRPRR
jgi:Putative prokaryotic signal transducing protein